MNDTCHICHHQDLTPVSLFHQLKQVTSDCRPYPRHGHMVICQRCGTVQKLVNDAYRSECDEIYDSYALYHQSGGTEQKIFSQSSGASAARSEVMLSAPDVEKHIPDSGRLLDVGCGNGSLLRSFNAIRPTWSTWGCELHDANRAIVEAIPGVAGFHVGDVAKLDEQFDMVTLQHSLEHIFSPVEFLSSLRRQLAPEGLLLVEVPNYMANAFDLVIADHATHFDRNGLERVIEAAGYDIIFSSDAVVSKELTLLARNTQREQAAIAPGDNAETMVEDSLTWLGAIRDQAKTTSAKGAMGVFGTAIAGAWLLSELGEGIAFFVDQDTTRTGKDLFGIPVHAPEDAPKAPIMLPFPTVIARSIAERLSNLGLELVLPPDPS